jgi:hypothetical protein
MGESFAGGAAKMEWFLNGRVMSHPRQDVVLYTVYSATPGCQRVFARENAGPREASPYRPLCPIAPRRDIVVN